MTTQNAGPDGSLDADEAERLASMIKPAWEIEGEGDDDGAPAAEAAAVDAADPSASSPPSHDTLVDGVPSISVGASDPGSSPEGEAAVPSQEAPKAAGPTKVGLGEAEPDADAPQKRRPRTTDREVTEAVGRPLVSADDVPASSRKRTTGAPIVPQAASFSKYDDPIEIPVESKPKGLIYGLGAAALAAVVLIGWLATRSEPTTTPTPTATAAAKTVPVKTAAPEPEKPAATATAVATPEPTATATAAATAEPTATATATPTATPTATHPEPIAAAPKPTSGGTKPASGGTKPASGGTKPASGGSKGSGGIMRDAPF